MAKLEAQKLPDNSNAAAEAASLPAAPSVTALLPGRWTSIICCARAEAC